MEIEEILLENGNLHIARKDRGKKQEK